MKQHILRFLEGTGRGVITVPEARQLGCSAGVLRHLVREGSLTRVAMGVYVSSTQLNSPVHDGEPLQGFALTEHQHLLRLDALLRLHGSKVAASHQSAVLAWGLPTAADSLRRIHLVHSSPGRTARRRDTHTLHTCELDDVITEHKKRLVVVPALAVIGQAMEVGLTAGVACMDAAIVAKLTSRTELDEMVERMRHSPRLGLARRALELTDGLAESPGETRLRLILTQLGITFFAQHWIQISGTSTYYRVDFYLPEFGVILEYDGQVKYGLRGNRHRGTSRSGNRRSTGNEGQTLSEEKTREDDLRLDGFGVGRVTSSKLTPERVRRIIATAQPQAQPSALHRPAEPPPWARSSRAAS